MKITSVGEDVEKLEPSRNAGAAVMEKFVRSQRAEDSITSHFQVYAHGNSKQGLESQCSL